MRTICHASSKLVHCPHLLFAIRYKSGIENSKLKRKTKLKMHYIELDSGVVLTTPLIYIALEDERKVLLARGENPLF